LLTYVFDLEKLGNLRLHPNPTSGMTFFSDLENSDKIESVIISNIRGEILQIIDNPEKSIDLSYYTDGTYIIVVIMDKKIGHLGRVVKI